jgi:hypothetical protein
MSREHNEGRGSGAPRMLILGTERSTVAREEKHPKGKLPGTMVSKPRRPLGALPQELCICTQFRSKPSSCKELFVSSFLILSQRYVFQMFVYSLLWRIHGKFWEIGYKVRILCHYVFYRLSGLKSTAVGVWISASSWCHCFVAINTMYECMCVDLRTKLGVV